MEAVEQREGGLLSVVATPIGNLADISQRAIDVLRVADIVACEDTRVTGKLLRYLGLSKKKMLQYHEHNGERQRPAILDALAEGKRVALVSDAGTPLISDPGYKLVREVREAGYHVEAIPGACSVVAALSIAGLPTNRFLFLGFLPSKRAARCGELRKYASLDATLVCFESPNRVVALLEDAREVLGEREVVIARELSKRFEEVIRGNDITDLLRRMDSHIMKGEMVVIFAPFVGSSDGMLALSDDELENMLREALRENSTKDAARIVSQETGIPRKKLYDMALSLRLS